MAHAENVLLAICCLSPEVWLVAWQYRILRASSFKIAASNQELGSRTDRHVEKKRGKIAGENAKLPFLAKSAIVNPSPATCQTTYPVPTMPKRNKPSTSDKKSQKPRLGPYFSHPALCK